VAQIPPRDHLRESTHSQPIETGAFERPFPVSAFLRPKLLGRFAKGQQLLTTLLFARRWLHRRSAILLRGQDLGVTHQLLLDVNRGIGAAEPAPIVMPKDVPSDPAEAVLGCKLVTFVMD